MRRLLLLFFVLLSLRGTGQVISTVAGGATGHGGYWGEGGQATAAQLGILHGIEVDKYNNIYIADGNNQRILKVDNITHIITTIGGTGIAGYGGDGSAATAAQLNNAYSLAFDNSGNLYIADAANDRIRMINSSGIITTIAGNGIPGYYGDGGPATLAKLNSPLTICTDLFDNLYIEDDANNVIRKVTPTGIISTVVGNGVAGFSGDGGLATNASIYGVRGMTVDKAGNLYLADWHNNRLRKVNTTTGIITTIAGTGLPYFTTDGVAATASNIAPWDVYVDDTGSIYIADHVNNRTRLVDSFGIIHTIAGTGVTGFSGDGGLATAADINRTANVIFDQCGNLLIADSQNKRVRKVSYSGSIVPAITITSSPSGTVCTGTSVTYTPVITDGGTSPAYQWIVNGVVVSGSSSYTYTPANGDSLRCVLTSSSLCASPHTVSSSSIYMVVDPVTATAAITASPSGAVCAGTSVTYTAATTGGGTTPIYQWYVNGAVVAGSSSYTYTPAHNDSVRCVLTSSSPCAVPATTSSASIFMVVDPVVTPSIVITASPEDTVCVGTPVTYTAAVTNGGPAPVYTWYVNGIAIPGSSSYTYTSASGDSISCTLTGSAPCSTPPTAGSNTVPMVVTPHTTPAISLSGISTYVLGSSVAVTASVTGAGSYNIYWRNKGVLFATTTVPSVTYTKTAGTDTITAMLVANAGGCTDTANAGMHIVTVNNAYLGIAANAADRDVSIHPNPTQNELTINAPATIAAVTICNAIGQVVYRKEYHTDNVQVDVGKLPAGVYTVKITGEGWQVVKKVVKE